MEKKYQIFISSTYDDLKEERKIVQDTILSMYHFPIGMEMFSAADEEQWKIIKETIDSSDYYVLIIANRYGTLIEKGEDKGISYTEKEYRYAKSRNIPILAFIINKSVPRLESQRESNTKLQRKLSKFIDEVKTGRMIQWWTTGDDLASKVMNSLNKQFIKGKRPGWIRTTDSINSYELDKAKSEIENLQKINEKLMEKSYELPSMFLEALDLRDMKCYISQNNKINNFIILENEYNRNANGHIVYFTNNINRKKVIKDEFIMLAYTYPLNQNWVKYYYNDYALFFSIRGSENINQVQIEIKEKNTNLICILHKKFYVDENKQDFFIRLRDCDIRYLSNIREICFTIYNDFYNDIGKCEFEVCDVWLKQLSTGTM